MAPKTSTNYKTTAGIVTGNDGERHIPSSVRADGSTRKEIRIRPGYQPPEDVKVYKNKTAEGFRVRGSGGIPGAESLQASSSSSAAASSTPNEASSSSSAAASKNAKRREARKRAKASEGNGDGDGDDKDSQATRESTASGKPDQQPDAVEKSERDKQVRKLKKRLREARELQEKRDQGEKLLQEQFEKVVRMTELIRELDKLGFDAEGEPKKS